MILPNSLLVQIWIQSIVIVEGGLCIIWMLWSADIGQKCRFTTVQTICACATFIVNFKEVDGRWGLVASIRGLFVLIRSHTFRTVSSPRLCWVSAHIDWGHPFCMELWSHKCFRMTMLYAIKFKLNFRHLHTAKSRPNAVFLQCHLTMWTHI